MAQLVEVLRYKLEGRGFDCNCVTGIFCGNNPSGRIMTLGLTQPRTEMSTRNISLRGKGGRCIGLATLPPSCVDCLEIWESQPDGILRAPWACNGTDLPFMDG